MVHRGSGVGLLLFHIIYVSDTSLVVSDLRVYNTVIGIYNFWSGWLTNERHLLQGTYALTLAVWIVRGYLYGSEAM